MKKILITSLLVLALVGVAGGAVAQVDPSPDKIPIPASTGADLIKLVEDITDWIFAVFLLIAVIFIILAAVQFVTSGGSAEKVTEARQKLIWAAVGIIVALLARAVPAVIQNIIGGS